jgi:glutaredoxin-like protein
MITTKLLNEEITRQIREVFGQLKEPVQVLFFEKKTDCEACADARQLVEEVIELSDKISFQAYDLEAEAETARQFAVDKTPALVIAAREGDEIRDYGIRFYGIPSGHEFSTLIHDLVLVSSRDSGLDQQTRDFLAGLKHPVHMQVFVTPTCPYCPRAVITAHQMAMESALVIADGVEATEFPELADRFHVSGVPQTTINAGAGTVVGAAPASHLMAEITRALGKQQA